MALRGEIEFESRFSGVKTTSTKKINNKTKEIKTALKLMKRCQLVSEDDSRELLDILKAFEDRVKEL